MNVVGRRLVALGVAVCLASAGCGSEDAPPQTSGAAAQPPMPPASGGASQHRPPAPATLGSTPFWDAGGASPGDPRGPRGDDPPPRAGGGAADSASGSGATETGFQPPLTFSPPGVAGDAAAPPRGGASGQPPRYSPPPREINEALAASRGIRALRGKYITLYTDLPADPEVECLPEVFDQAYPQWCEYFGIPQQLDPPWRIHAFVMGQRQAFRDTGLLPDDLPPFEHGYARGLELWMDDQPSAYYRRHLLLHEGTHAFMHSLLYRQHPPLWYNEGIAEWMATHRWEQGRLQLRYFPHSRDEVPYWGRIKLLRDAFRNDRAMHLQELLANGPRNDSRNELYAWSWAACAFLGGHPRYAQRFAQLHTLLDDPLFNQAVFQRYDPDARQLYDEWQVFLAELEYGYDLGRMAVEFRPGVPLPSEGAEIVVAADRGWQSTGYRVEAGRMYELTASGRVRLRAEPQAWWSQADGVSIQYYQGFPLGMLLAAVRPDDSGYNRSPFLNPAPLGSHVRDRAAGSGTLYLRINDAPDQLADNAGILMVRLREVP
jgi:hypothetical protein